MNALQAASNVMDNALKKLRVRSTKGDDISLDKLATLKQVSAATGVYRLDMYPAVRIGGSSPKGTTSQLAASKCVERIEAERKNLNDAKEFAVVNLTDQ